MTAAGYVCCCKAGGYKMLTTIVAEKIDRAGRDFRQIEVCDRRARVAIEREQARAWKL